MKTKLNWWKTILSCIALLIIFLAVAFLSDIATKWMSNRSIRFAVREIVLRLPLTLYLMKLFVTKVLKMKISTFNIRKSCTQCTKWLIVGMIISLVFLFATLVLNELDFMYKRDSYSSKWIVYFVVSTIAMAINGGILEETLFRGYIMGLVREKWNTKVAIILPSMIFGLMHLTMINSFNIMDILFLFFGGTMVGIMFSLIVIKTNNVCYASIVHFVWNIFFAGKILKISHLPFDDMNAIFCFKLKSQNLFLNGGNFGIEVSAIAILIYIGVSLILLKKKAIN